MFTASCYEARGEVITRLRHSVIMLGRRPVLVAEVYENKDLECVALRDSRKERVPLDDERINLEIPALGYINTNTGAVYMKRRPVRRYKQGLVMDNITNVGRLSEGFRVFGPEFADMLQGRYPSLEEARGSSSVNPFRSFPIAFSRKLALQGNSLFYKGKQVGQLTKDGELRLSDDYIYLREEILGEINA